MRTNWSRDDLFIAYASEDRERIRPLVEQFKAQGWKVWWDEMIPTGQQWRGAIVQNLNEALCVVVVWTKSSVNSSYVREEAELAKNQNKLIQVMIDNEVPPYGFAETQAVKLDSQNNYESPMLKKLHDDIRSFIRKKRGLGHYTSKARTKEKKKKRKYKRILNILNDVPDTRDKFYEPPSVESLPLRELPTFDTRILDQKSSSGSIGFALASVINRLYQARGISDPWVSAIMLVSMAKYFTPLRSLGHAEFSLRSALQGLNSMGVCSERSWPFQLKNPGILTVDQAREARRNKPYAYYRIQHKLAHFQSAIKQLGAIYVSAKVHKGWTKPEDGTGIITQHSRRTGGHAFAIVGYDNKGFLVQNSWGDYWGNNGYALWPYEDWQDNLMDAWAVFMQLPGSTQPTINTILPFIEKTTAKRSEIAGHFIHIDDGWYSLSGRYWSTPEDVEQTAKLVANSSKYDHLLFYIHGGLNSSTDSTKRIAAMKERFKSNGIYPFHILYDTGIAEELRDLIIRKEKEARERVGKNGDWIDRITEGLIRRQGTFLWQEMKQDTYEAFASRGAGTDALNQFFKLFKKFKKNKKVHLLGHSSGAIAIAHLLHTLRRYRLQIETCALLAPACSVDLYHSHYLPVLQGKTSLKIKDMTIYNLKDELERDAPVAEIYRKSLLYLISNALEQRQDPLFSESQPIPLLGMEVFAKLVKTVSDKPRFIYSNGVDGQRTRSTTHGGFDNDIYTMNHVLERMLGKKPKDPFTEEDLDY